MRFELYKDRNKQWRWRLFAKNGRKVADSAEGYMRRQDCTRMVDRIKAHSMFAPVEDVTK